eukprot:TRINITY_DN36_c0_g1_i1.p1 TRINITY_DN36_c0_g1~~TRINITY_DN36_c0_g1_i1.p1  ORF type:complete len:304 (-),score=109.79 TRINITY_DN36_c0_g1_i1:62-877(-)
MYGQQGGYGGYPAQQGGYPAQQGGYPPQQGGYPPTGGYPPQGGQPGGYGGYPGQQPMGGMPGGAPAGGTVFHQTTTTVRTQMGNMPPPSAGFQNSWYGGLYNSIGQQEMMEIQNWFRSVDRDGSGTITPAEVAGITFNGQPLGIEVATKLVRVFDKDRSNNIDFHEYAALHKFLATLQTAFFAGDRDRSGRLDPREIHVALQTCGFQIGLPAVQGLCSRYNAPYGLSFMEYTMVCCTIAQARSLFEWRDTGRTGRLTLTLDQLLELVGQMG